ncbi:MAG: sulfite exporter TauE/SafE family protein [Burkholderiales bacterium]|nr:sulfite exporter TauE/SafE family protein [Burkholderiales bacterium]MDP2399789.1 sulfite exporter TauE/SafE family protein [Burkholderiales bacterium]
MDWLPFDLATWAACAVIVGGAYVIFGITAFGAAMFTVPALSYFFPLDYLLPMCVILDVSAAFALGSRFSRDADIGELKWMAPFSLAGAVAGVTALVTLPQQATIAAFGIFLCGYGLYSLLAQAPQIGVARHPWAVISGFCGGAAGTLFGVGAPPYAIYLSRRLPDKAVLRATLSNMVLLSTSIRALVFLVGGLMLWDRILGALLLLPFALGGIWAGHRIQLQASRETLLKVIGVLLLLIGASLLLRVLR